jgi:hypothetical protein
VSPATVSPATDDWPFLYLRPGSRPKAYAVVLAAILAGAWWLVRGTIRRDPGGFDWHLFLMGAAFMLVEVKSVAELSLLFGSTWLVNSVVFSGILIMILAANAIVARVAPARVGIWYACLAASLLAGFAFPRAILSSMPLAAGATAGTLLTSLPIFFAGIIFAIAFRTIGRGSAGLAANLFGAVVGGTLEYASLFIGIRSLNLVALVLYGLSFAVLASRGLAPQRESAGSTLERAPTHVE